MTVFPPALAGFAWVRMVADLGPVIHPAISGYDRHRLTGSQANWGVPGSLVGDRILPMAEATDKATQGVL